MNEISLKSSLNQSDRLYNEWKNRPFIPKKGCNDMVLRNGEWVKYDWREY